MTTYLLTLDEESRQGRAIRQLLDSMDEQTLRLTPLGESDEAEETALAVEIGKASGSPLLDYEASKREFARLRQGLKR